MNTVLNASDYLRNHGIKPSLQRIAIMEYLLSHRIHPTVEDIYNALCEKIPTLSRTTIYNTMKLFASQGAVQVLTIDEKNTRFDVDVTLHAHFQCCSCGKILDISLGDDVCLPTVRIGNLEVTESHLYYKGFCPNCKQEQ